MLGHCKICSGKKLSAAEADIKQQEMKELVAYLTIFYKRYPENLKKKMQSKCKIII